MEITDSKEITNQTLKQDQCLLLDLDPVISSSNETTVLWTNTGGNLIDWNIGYHYLDTSNVFQHKELVFHQAGGCYANPPASNVDPCFEISEITGLPANKKGIKITTTDSVACNPARQKPLYYTLKPACDSVTIDSLTKVGSIPLQRTIRSVTTSSNTANSNQQNPTSVLETKYLLTKQPICLFNYALRTEQSVEITGAP
jgi:hypothetical protein